METIEKVAEIVSELSKCLKEIQNNNYDILGYSEKASNHMKQTDEIMEFVRGVSKQTKLLGINAKIEAAHAGPAGRTFTVVAEEIERVSVTTAEAMNKILTILQNVNVAIDAVSSKLVESSEIINIHREALDQVAVSIGEIGKVNQVG